MKTTIDISDALLFEAKMMAAAQGTTLRQLVEAGLRHALGQRQKAAKTFRLRKAVFTGKGTHERDYKRAATLVFDKQTEPKYIELKVRDIEKKLQPEFEVKESK